MPGPGRAAKPHPEVGHRPRAKAARRGPAGCDTFLSDLEWARAAATEPADRTSGPPRPAEPSLGGGGGTRFETISVYPIR